MSADRRDGQLGAPCPAGRQDRSAGADATERYDVVAAADGIHPNTRRLVLGPEAPFKRYLGYCHNGFTMPKFLGLSHESVSCATPGRCAVVSAVKVSRTLHAILIFASETPPFSRYYDAASQRRLTEEKFAGIGWEVPALLDAMQHADGLYDDAVGHQAQLLVQRPCGDGR